MFHCIARTQLVILTLGVTCIVGLNEKQKYVEACEADTAKVRIYRFPWRQTAADSGLCQLQLVTHVVQS
jgi:hypothetical protein